MKKVLISFAVAFVTVMTILFCGALDTSAEIFSGNCGTADSSVTWTLDTVTGILSLKGNGSTKDYSKSAVSGTTAPPWRKYADSIKTVSVDGLSGIGKFAFAGCENLASVSFPEEITVIKEGVFYGCTSLRSFELTKNVTEIGESAFYDCRALTELSFPAGLVKIGKDALFGCSGLRNISVEDGNIAFRADKNCLIDIARSSIVRGSVSGEIPESVKCIGEGAFSGCANLTEILIPDTVVYIGYGAFSGCTNAVSITLPFVGDTRIDLDGKAEYVPEGEEDKERGKLQNCLWYLFGDLKTPESLKNVTVTDTQTLGLEAFAGCNALESIRLCDSLVRIDSGAFYGCTSLREIKIPQKVTTIGNSAFYGCTGLTELTVPDSTVTLGNYAFENCKALESITLGSSLLTLGGGAFGGCENLKNIKISEANPKYRSETGCVIEIESRTLVVGCNATQIPDGILAIGDGAFKSCTGITSVIIPDGVKKIGNSAFEGCRNMTSVRLPEGLESVGDYAFADCVSLESVRLPASVSYVGDSAFKNCTSFRSDGNASPLDDDVSCASCNACSGSAALISIAIITVCAFALTAITKRK